MYSANAGVDESPFASVVVGGGPGGLGPLLWAAQNVRAMLAGSQTAVAA